MKLAVAGVLGLAFGIVLPGAAQQPFRSTTDLVPVFATVLDKNGQFVHGLTRDDFTILDDGKPQTIVGFSDEAQAISVSVIIDTSGSMAATRSRAFAAARVFLDQLRPDDRAMMNTLTYQGPPFTSDKSRLRTSLDLAPPDIHSPVYPGLDRSLTSLATETNRPVIVIYTDGKNVYAPYMGSGKVPPGQATAASVQLRAERAGVMVYPVGFEGVRLTNELKSLAKRTGGRATELKKTDDLSAVFASIADELHQQYLLGFTPTAFDGKTHTIEVRVKSADQIVRARQSYVSQSKNP